MSTQSSPTDPAGPAPATEPGPGRERTLERRLLGWLLALTVAPSLVLLAVGGWALATSLDIAGALGPWEEVAASGRRVVELAEPIGDTALVQALATHRQALSQSLTQARRWAFLGERFVGVLPWLVLAVAAALVALAYAATRRLARQLARPIEDLVVVAERLGRTEPLPEPPRRSLREVRVLDTTLREAAAELEAARERAVAAERVRVWGEMARRVAHEMKNPLTPLRFAAHRLKSANLDGPVAASGLTSDVVEVIDEEVSRLDELAGQFGQLGRPPEGPPTEVDLRELLGSLLETDVTGTTRTTVEAPDDLPPARGHYDSLFRAFRNVVRNAVEAVDGRPDPWIGVSLAVEGDAEGRRWLVARVSDNGGGLPAHRVDRIFEPDFTTKNRGTGLGLALVRHAVTSDGGTVEAGNRDGGAEFVIRLPVAGPVEEDPRSGDEEKV